MPTRAISTDIWSDGRFVALSAHAKLVYLRLVTGPETSPAGAIRVAPQVLGAYVGIAAKQVERSVDELVAADLVRRYDDWLWLPKFIHYQLSGPGFITAIRRSTKGLPESLRVAVDRALTAKVGPAKARSGANPDDKGPTRKSPTSRKKRGQTPGETGGQTEVGPGVRPREGEGPELTPLGLVSSGTAHEESEPLGLRGPGAQASQNGDGNGHPSDAIATAAEASPTLRAALATARARGER